MSRFVSIAQLAAHADKHPLTVRRALGNAGIKCDRPKGAKGIRIELNRANTFLSRQWPEVPPIKLEEEA